MTGQEGKETEGALEFACLGDSGIEGQSKITALWAAGFSEAAQIGGRGSMWYHKTLHPRSTLILITSKGMQSAFPALVH